MKERLAEILYKIGLKRIAFIISPNVFIRLRLKKWQRRLKINRRTKRIYKGLQ